MSYRDNLDLVFETDGLGSITKALAAHDTIQDQIATVIEREKWHGQRQASVSGVSLIDALEDYVDRRAEQIRQELAGMPTREQMEAEWTRDWRASR